MSSTTTGPGSGGRMASEPRRRARWTVRDLTEILTAQVPPETLRETDRQGMTPVVYGTMRAAETTEALLPLLDLLNPPEEGEDRLAALMDVLEAMAERQVRIEAKLDRLLARPERG